MVRRHYLLYVLSIVAIYLLAACAHTDNVPHPDVAAHMGASLEKHKAAAVGIAVIKGGEITWAGTLGEHAPGFPVVIDAMALLDPDSLIAAFGGAQMGR